MPERRTCPKCSTTYWWPAAGWQHDDAHCPPKQEADPVTNVPVVTNIVTNRATVTNASVTNSDIARVRRWREKNRAAYNAKQRELMRARRAAARVAA